VRSRRGQEAVEGDALRCCTAPRRPARARWSARSVETQGQLTRVAQAYHCGTVGTPKVSEVYTRVCEVQ
jgi:hypothetical protein